MTNLDELRDTLNEAAKAIARVDNNPRTWLTWITYLLDRLEEQATGVNAAYQQSYKEMLAALQESIRNRLKTGGW